VVLYRDGSSDGDLGCPVARVQAHSVIYDEGRREASQGGKGKDARLVAAVTTTMRTPVSFVPGLLGVG
jgi:hypothetical protein